MSNLSEMLASLVDPRDIALWLTSADPSSVSMGFGERRRSGQKGLGYLGMIDNSTELSAEDIPFGEYPLMIPGLSREELRNLLEGTPPDSVFNKAVKHAEMRRTVGNSPFASVFESPRRGALSLMGAAR
jgi:hypothetical protein